MKINLNPKKGGIKIKGDREELLGLMDTISEAVDVGEGTAHMLTKDGVELVRIVCDE